MTRSRQTSPRVLLTFTGYHDPFAAGAVSGVEQEGPVLATLRTYPLDRVVLISTPNTLERTEATASAIRERHSGIAVETHHIPLDDPTDYVQILNGLRTVFAKISGSLGAATYFVATASGTPQMHASWVLLAASGEIPARLLQVRPSRFVTAEKPEVTEVDPSKPEFPTVRSRTWARLGTEESKGTIEADLVQSLGIVGDHPAIVRALETAALLARSEVPVLLLGESGTGKERVAEFIHLLSGRASKPLVAVNCAAIPSQLAESTLFGHKRGAFSGATSDLQGRFETADGGTLFLDEVAELPPETQAKLLRVLQDGVIEPLGAAKGKTVSVRVIAATNRDLRAAIADGAFREDLYYRLAVGELFLPALRERRTDITKLAIYFLDEINLGLRQQKRFTPKALAVLQAYDWPGNVRELQNAIQRAAVLSKGEEISPGQLGLPDPGRRPTSVQLPEPREGFSAELFLKEARKDLFERALEIAHGNQSEAARLLGVSPQAVFKFRKNDNR